MLFGCLSYAAHCDTFSSHVDWFLMVIKVFSLHCISVLNAMRNKSLLIENLFETGCDHCNPVWKSFPCWLVFPLLMAALQRVEDQMQTPAQIQTKMQK